MKHLLGDQFLFAVLDDVLMSVDVGHRREVCRLLKEKFPNTQFKLSTHDGIWLRHMRSEGLIGGGDSIQFRKWDVDQGPTEWEDRDVWGEINKLLDLEDVRGAASLLRYYMEFVSAEACHYLRARVEYRGDASYQLGDLLPAACGRLMELLKEARTAAASWGQNEQVTVISEREAKFAKAVTTSNVEQWSVNPAIHYNAWANMTKADFRPVLEALKNLVAEFHCNRCESMFSVVPERGAREIIKCSCAGVVNYNLKKKKQS